MNSTILKNQTLDYWLNLIGSTKLLDSLYFYILTPISGVSFILNSMVFYVLYKNFFQNSTFYNYLKVYVLNCLVLSFLQMTAFTNKTYRLFGFTNTYGAMFYGCYLYTPLV